jgi:hypothetical protein
MIEKKRWRSSNFALEMQWQCALARVATHDFQPPTTISLKQFGLKQDQILTCHQ